MTTARILILVLLSSACGAAGAGGTDAARADGASACTAYPACDGGCTASEDPCTNTPDSCGRPYECVTVENHETDASTDLCLVPCDEQCDCPDECICKGVSGGSDFGPDGYCIRV